MIERLIVFLVLGAFVFAPGIDHWNAAGLRGWYFVYIPWLVIIALAIRYARQQGENP